MKSFYHNKSGRRLGAAVVEAAVTLPLIFIVILSSVEICNRIFLQQSLSIIAYEGARVATIPDASMDDVQMQVDDFAVARSLTNLSVTVTPSDFQNAPDGTFIEVKVTAADQKSIATSLFPFAESTASVAMMKEFD